jgi:hypothetical protein
VNFLEFEVCQVFPPSNEYAFACKSPLADTLSVTLVVHFSSIPVTFVIVTFGAVGVLGLVLVFLFTTNTSEVLLTPLPVVTFTL